MSTFTVTPETSVHVAMLVEALENHLRLLKGEMEALGDPHSHLKGQIDATRAMLVQARIVKREAVMENTMSPVERLTAEDLDFLTALANELKTQDRAGTAKPVFYQVQETKKHWGMDDDYADGWVLIVGDDDQPDEFYHGDLAKAKYHVLLNYDIETQEAKDEVDGAETLEELAHICQIHNIPAKHLGYAMVNRYHGCFLTLKECRTNINSHLNSYEDPRTYAQYGGYSAEYARLLDIVEKFATVERVPE